MRADSAVLYHLIKMQLASFMCLRVSMGEQARSCEPNNEGERFAKKSKKDHETTQNSKGDKVCYEHVNKTTKYRTTNVYICSMSLTFLTKN